MTMIMEMEMERVRSGGEGRGRGAEWGKGRGRGIERQGRTKIQAVGFEELPAVGCRMVGLCGKW